MIITLPATVVQMPHSGLNPPRSQSPGPSSDSTPVSACMEKNECAPVENHPRGGSDPQDFKRKPRPNSEPLIVLRFKQPPDAAADFPHSSNHAVLYPGIIQPSIQSGGSCKGTINSEQEHTIDQSSRLTPIEAGNATSNHLANGESFAYTRSQTFDMRKNAVNPILFLRRWVQTRLPNDLSTAQLPKRIRAATEKTYFGQTFLPVGKFQKLVTSEAVQMELDKSNCSSLARMRSPVIIEDGSAYLKILSILYLIKQPSKIRMFVKAKVCDMHLPLERCLKSNKDDEYHILRSRHNHDAAHIKFKRRDYADDFFESQWKVLVPVLVGSEEGHVLHSVLEPESILPFITHVGVLKQGGSSDVFKTEIRCDRDKMGKINKNIYAIKVLRSGDRNAFKQEATILTKFTDYRHTHNHLITLLGTFEYAGVFHFIFPLANADLFDYWKRCENPPSNEDMDIWIIEQCRGLADGLNSVHRYATASGTAMLTAFDLNDRMGARGQRAQSESPCTSQPVRNFFGRHGDLKPENILHYPCDKSTGRHGILKITDFGAARFNTVNLWDTHKTGRLPNSATYRSPEIDLDWNLTTACDIWALGCVYLQFVTWYLGGNRLIEWFGQRRLESDPRMANIPTDTFFSLYEERGKRRARVKPAVVEVMEELREHCRCTDDFRSLLDMIQEDMLVVHQQGTSDEESFLNLSSRPRLGSTRRKSCGDVMRRIGDIGPSHDQEGDLA